MDRETIKAETEIIEKLAEIEHRQWMAWSNTVAEKEKNLSRERLERWKGLWKPYKLLSEEQKKSDRAWAREVFNVFKKCWLADRLQIEKEGLKCHFCGKLLDNTSYCFECLHGVRKEVDEKR